MQRSSAVHVLAENRRQSAKRIFHNHPHPAKEIMNTTTEQPAVKSQASSQKSTRPGPAAREPKRSWRVFPALCAAGVLWGAGGQALAVPYPYENTTALAIPDNNTTGISQTINVTDNFTVNDLNVGLNITHTYRGDLRIQLTSPAGTTVTLIAAGGNANANYDLQLDSASTLPFNDGNADTVAAPNYELDRVAKPSGSLSSFNGQNAIGLWTLNVADISGTDTGTRNKFRLSFDGTPVVTYTGRVYHDINGTATQDGTEAGYPGVSVRAYNAAGALVTTVTTDVNGDYLISGATGQLRVEFDLPVFNYATPGLGNRAVRFIAAGSSGNNLGIAGAADFCGTSPKIVVPCYVNGDPAATGASTAGLMDVIVAVDYNVANASSTAPTEIAIGNNVGAVWGMALQRETQSLFSAAFVKRHCGLKGSTGAIYKTNMGGTFPNGAAYTNLHGLVTSNGITVDTGDSVMGARGLPSNPNTANTDATAFDSVGKVGLGGLAISDDGATLWVTNLYQRTLIKINIGTPAKASITGADLTSYALPALTAANGVARPFAVAWRQGKVYVGVVATGENAGGTAADVDAHLMEFNSATAAWTGNAPIFSFPLDYAKGYVHYLETPTSFGPWIDTWAELYQGNAGSPPAPRVMRPQPMFSDIDFLVNGDIVMSFCDRAGHQTGYRNDDTSAAGTGRFSGYIGGDTLRARKVAGAWTLESNGIVGTGSTAVTGGGSGNSQGPGGGEFYGFERYFTDADNDGDLDEVHQETTQGSAVVLPGKAEIAATVMDPLAVFSGGFSWWGNTDGSDLRRYQIYGSSGATNPVLAGKSNGLGALALNCEPAPIEIGDRVWKDNNANGLQDPGEPAIANVCVGLYNTAGTQVALAESDANGYFLFTNAAGTDVDTDNDTIPNINRAVTLDYLGSYTLGVCATNFNAGSALNTLKATEANDGIPSSGGSDANDSDAVPVTVGAGATFANLGTPFVLKGSGVNVQEIDFGFTPEVAIGNLVFSDNNGTGKFDSGDTGVNNVTVQLYDSMNVEVNVGPDGILGNADDAPGGVQTANGGCYLFRGLLPGNYTVKIPASEFSQELTNFQSLAGQGGDTVSDDNSDENGDDTETDGVSSTVIALGDNSEPTGEAGKDAANAINAADDNNTNLTVDFGFSPETVSLGNLVFLDSNNDGLLTSENGLSNALVQLFKSNNTPALNYLGVAVPSQTTGGSGQYLFTGLPAGDYYVRVTPPANYLPSTVPAVVDPDLNPADNDSNGIPVPAQAYVQSPVITLLAGSEPVNDDDNDPNTNTTVDFGFVPAVGVGNLVFADTNGDGIFGAGEAGIGGVDVQLFVQGANPLSATPVATTVTSTAPGSVGCYLFTGLVPGSYFVFLPGSEFASGGPLAGLYSTPGADASTADDTVSENGVDSPTPAASGISSGNFALGDNAQPVGEAGACNDQDNADDNNINLSVDFGFVDPVCLGSLVFQDTSDNNNQDNATPLGGATVQLLRSTSTGLSSATDVIGAAVSSVLSNASTGAYEFCNLPPGDYVLRVTPPATYVPLTSSTADPDNDSDTDNNGAAVAGQPYVQSGVITLIANSEPTGDGAPGAGDDNNSNNTLDIGFKAGVAPSPTAIGDYVWCDTNGNGIQDNGETGLDGVEVKLNIGASVFTATTSGGGLFIFSSATNVPALGSTLTGAFTLTIDQTQSPLAACRLATTANAGTDATDSDATSNGTLATISGTVPVSGTADLTTDFGFTPGLCIGNLVFNDTNRDGLSIGEIGLAGATVQLFAGDGTTPATDATGAVVGSILTTSSGIYNFCNLPPGNYVVKVSPPVMVNNVPGSPTPTGYVPTTAAATVDPDTNPADSDSNNTPASSPLMPYMVASTAVTLTTGGEPINDADTDANTNTTVDFGFYAQVGVGNLVWLDKNSDSIFNAGDLGVGSVIVQVWPEGANPLVGTTPYTATTNTSGFWLVTSAPPGRYFAFIPPANFAPGAPLEGYVSRPGVEIEPLNSAADDDAGENGIDDPNPALNGIRTRNFNLRIDREPYVSFGETGAGANDDIAPAYDDDSIDLTKDFAFSRALCIGNIVVLDDEADGTIIGDAPLAGVTVALLKSTAGGLATATDLAGVPVPPAITLLDGKYKFANLPAADYVVRFTPPAGYTGVPVAADPDPDTNPSDSDNNALPVAGQPWFETPVFSLTEGGEPTADGDGPDSNLTVDAAFAPSLGHLGNLVWLDENSNGLQDEGERGIANVTVNVYSSMGALVASTVTDARGGWGVNVFPGDYYADVVEATLPVGLTQTPLVNAGADFGNQDQSGSGYAMTVAASGENLSGDFGYNYNPAADVIGSTGTAALGDRVWLDEDSDGAQDSDEAPLSGVVLTLCTAGPDNRFGTPDDVSGPTATTDATGYYIFDGLTPGAYVVKVTSNLSAIYVQTGDPDQFGTTGPTDGRTTTPVVLAPGDVFLNVDFGYRPIPSQSNCVGDYVWLDLNADGLQEATEPAIPGVTVALLKDTNGNGARDPGEPVIDTQITNSQGIYHFLALPDGKYLVWITDTDHVLDNLVQTYDVNGLTTPNISAVDLDSAGTNPVKALDFTHDFGYTPAGQSATTGAIGNYVWLDQNRDGVQDAGESPIEGVLVRLCDSTGATLLAAARTDENGRYWFAGLDPSASYTVKVDPVNFTAGHVLSGFTNTWDADSLLVSPNGMSAVNLAAAGSDGNNDTDGLNNNINPGQDFGYAAPAGSSGTIGNLVWLDQNADGVSQGSSGPDGLAGSDDDEPGVAGVTLDLYRDLNGNGLVDADEPRVANTVTNSTGAYLFTALPFGTYVVDVTDTAGILHGYWHSSGATGLSDNSQSDAYAAAITASAPNNLTADFGYYVEPAALGNYVFADADSSGTQNSGDTGIPNVEVTLTIAWPAGGTTVLKTLTDSSGHYRFTNLLADENHACGTGPTADSNAPAIPVSALLPRFTISVAGAQSALSLYTTTTSNSGANDKLDSDNPAGVVAKPVQGLTNVSGQTPASTENAIASYDFGYVEGGKASTFAAWQAQNPLGGANGRTQNPDGDRYNNFLEYAFCLPPGSGANTPFCVVQTGATSASLEFTRPSGLTDATYTPEVTGALGNPTAWTPLVGNLLITDNGNGTETLTYSGIVPAGSASGTSAFYRIAVTDTSTSQTYYTEIQGWLRHDLVNGCETFACPLLPKAIATGFVGSVTGQVLDLSISLGTANLTALLTPGTAYYIEITSRDNEGHRFDIDARTASSITLANDSDLCAAAAPYNTKAGAAPASLTGDAFAIYPHRTIAGMFPTAGYQSGNSPSTGDRILIKRGNAWDIYWLYTNGAGPAYWDLDGDGSFSDMGADVVPVSQGLFVHRLGAPALAHLCVGEVRASAYCAPLCEADGCTLLAPGYPLNQSPEDLGILLADGWDGDRNPTIADKFLIWNGDSGADVGYACYWLADGGPTSTYRYWTVDGDVTLPNHDVSKVILRSRSLFMKPHAPRPDWCQPKPYTP
jgi:subtilisin-like proprotein convertase family protein